MKALASALALAALLALGSSASAASNPPAPFFASTANASKAKAKSPAKSSFWGGSCQGTCTLSCGDTTKEYYDVSPEACCSTLESFGCPGNTQADGAEFWPTFSTDPGGCYAVLCS